MFNFETKRICFVTYHQFFLLLERQNKLGPYTGCVRQNENPTNFKILKEPLLVQRQTLHQQKALDLSFLELEAQGSGSIMGVPCPFGAKSVFCWLLTGAWRVFDAFRGEKAWCRSDNATLSNFLSPKSWDQELFADVRFVSVIAMVLSESWKLVGFLK